VYVSGIISAEGTGGLFEVDLLTGANRQLARGQIQGFPMGPTLSPDGTTLAVAEIVPGRHETGTDLTGGFLRSQIFLVSVSSGAAQRLGQPLDTAFISWLPDSSGLLLITRKYESLNKPSVDAVARLSLDGSLTEMFPGSSPQLVLSGTRILFQDNQNQRWFTCDLTGADRTQLGDGLAEFGFPSPAPHGYQVAMMKFGGSNGPRPYVVDIQSGVVSPIRVAGGLWTRPAWK
jgi:Tol biopolymer transport system component